MDIREFIENTIIGLNTRMFEALRENLVDEYIKFLFVDKNKITQEVFAEKVGDYFEKLSFKTNSDFERILQKYASDLDDIVKRKIAKESNKKDNPEDIPRSRQYYVKATELRNSRSMTMRQITDYSRIMMCLYMASIRKDGKEIEDFDYSVSCLNLNNIISSMKTEKGNGIGGLGKKPMFDIAELYCTNTATFILTMIMFFYIKDNEVLGDY